MKDNDYFDINQRNELKPKRDVTAYSKALRKAYSSSEDLCNGA